jgi:hypothetical protein
MSDKPKKRSRAWIGWALIAALVLYPLSIGPVTRLVLLTNSDGEWLSTITRRCYAQQSGQRLPDRYFGIWTCGALSRARCLTRLRDDCANSRSQISSSDFLGKPRLFWQTRFSRQSPGGGSTTLRVNYLLKQSVPTHRTEFHQRPGARRDGKTSVNIDPPIPVAIDRTEFWSGLLLCPIETVSRPTSRQLGVTCIPPDEPALLFRGRSS